MSDIPESWYGHAAVPRAYYRCQRCGREMVKGADGGWVHKPKTDYRGGDETTYYNEQRAAKKQAQFDKAVPYAGAITHCQVQVAHPMGRVTDFGRCERKARFVVRVKSWALGGGSKVEDVLAVCGQHAKMPDARRWIQNNPSHYAHGGPSASEQVEPEYAAQVEAPA